VPVINLHKIDWFGYEPPGAFTAEQLDVVASTLTGLKKAPARDSLLVRRLLEHVRAPAPIIGLAAAWNSGNRDRVVENFLSVAAQQAGI